MKFLILVLFSLNAFADHLAFDPNDIPAPPKQKANSQYQGNKLVKAIYFEPNDVSSLYTYDKKQRFQTGLELGQRYYGMEMSRYGNGFKTFNIEKDKQNGRPKVYHHVGEFGASFYGLDKSSLEPGYDSYFIYSRLAEELNPQYNPDGSSILLLICKNCPWLGSGSYYGGGLAMTGDYLDSDFGVNIPDQMATFCDQSQPEPNTPGWETATRAQLSSARVGGLMHELGHALSAPHSPDTSLMGSGGHFAFARYFVSNSCMPSDVGPSQIGESTAAIFKDNPFLSAKPDLTPQNQLPFGHLDYASLESNVGWAYDSDTPGSSVQVNIYVNGTLRKSVLADKDRPDLYTSRFLPTGRYGFSFDLSEINVPEGDPIILDVKAVDTSTGQETLLVGSTKVLRAGWSANIVPNGNFETVETKELTWDLSRKTAFSPTVGIDAPAGNVSMYLSTNAKRQVDQVSPMPIAANKKFKLEGSILNGPAYVKFVWLRRKSSGISRLDILGPNDPSNLGKWTKFQAEVVSPANAKYLKVYLRANRNKGQWVMFDDISVRQFIDLN